MLSNSVSSIFPPGQALPYVALLIAMLFFIYAVIGMQVIFLKIKTSVAFSDIVIFIV